MNHLYAVSAVVLMLSGCATVSNLGPTITDIESPPDAHMVGTIAKVTSRARIDTRGWAYHLPPYFTFARSPGAVFSPSEATLVKADCTPVPNRPSVQDCRASFEPQVGTSYYQWHVDYGASASDPATLSRPAPPQPFTTTYTSWSGPAIKPPPQPPQPGVLTLYDPANGTSCAGKFYGMNVTQGETVVPLRWRGQNVPEGIAMLGDYQVVVEHPTAPNCTNAPGLDIDQPNAAMGYSPAVGCYVVRHDVNDTATPPLPANREFRWRVRRILANGQFEVFTGYSRFTTASPPTAPPTFTDPTPGAAISLPPGVAAQSRTIQWRMAGCPLTSFNYRLFEDGASVRTGTGVCADASDTQRCAVQVPLRPGKSYRFELTQSNTHGSINGTATFTTNSQ